jgi:hypothetical protein
LARMTCVIFFMFIPPSHFHAGMKTRAAREFSDAPV